MVENKTIVIVGIPGVGKTTLVSKIVDILKNKNKTVSVNSFGTIMFEEAKKNGMQDRDDLRKLPIEKQQELQKMAAEKLAVLNNDFIIIDTHAFISTPQGYNPGLPEHVLHILKPTSFIVVSAKPEEIYNRRMRDETRSRDKITITNIKKELDVQAAMLSACSVISGAPMKHVLNREGKVDEAADKIVNAIGA